MKKLVIGKEYYVDAAHLRATALAREDRRYMQDVEHHLIRSESILLTEDKAGLKTVTVIPAIVCEIASSSMIGETETQVLVSVDVGPHKIPLLAVVNPGSIYGEVSTQKTVKKVAPYNYTPERIIYNNPATIVFWKDGTKTVVKKNEKEKYNSYNAFCAALAKKIFGTNSEVNRIVRSGYNQKVAEGQKKLAEFKKKVEKARKAKKKGEKK